MSFEQRATIDYFSTSLLAQMTIGATTMQSADFVTKLPADYGTNGKYLPLVIHDDTLGVYEVVWVTAHTAGSNTVTVVRGKEGTSAQPWGAGARVESAPTAYDAVLARLAASLPTDPFIGQRVSRGDKSDILERVLGYWGPSVGAGIASDQKNNMMSQTAPDGSIFLLRMGTAGAATDANGKLSCTFQTPFPNQCHTLIPISTFIAAGGNLVVSAVRNTGADVYFMTGPNARLASASASYAYLAFGW